MDNQLKAFALLSTTDVSDGELKRATVAFCDFVSAVQMGDSGGYMVTERDAEQDSLCVGCGWCNEQWSCGGGGGG